MKRFIKELEDKILSSLIEFIDTGVQQSEYRKNAILIIRNAFERGKIKVLYGDHPVVYSTVSAIALMIELSMDDFQEHRNVVAPSKLIIEENLKALNPHFDRYIVSIEPILRNIGAHKVNYSERYFQERITSISKSMGSSNFNLHAERMLKALEQKDYSRAIGDARDALDSFMKHVVKKDEKDLGKLFKNFKEKLLSHYIKINGEHKWVEKYINECIEMHMDITSKIINDARNTSGSKGHDRDKILAKKHEAHLIVETAITIMSYSKELLECK